MERATTPIDAFAAALATPAGGDVALPSRLVIGDDSVDRVAEALVGVGAAAGPVLLVADAALVGLGPVERVEHVLATAGFETTVHAPIASEPDLAAAEAIVAAVRAQPYVAVVGLGGGSAMDLAKLAAGLATNNGPLEDYLGGGHPIRRKALVQALVPTTAGTGAEVSKNTIVTHAGRKFVIGSPLLCPDVAVLDPTLTVSCPSSVTAASGMDALAHAVEATLSTWATPFTIANAVTAVGAVAAWLPIAVGDGANLAARRAMLYAAHFAGLSINASTLLGHSMAYTIATRAHLAHGVTTAMALPYCVAYDTPGASHRVALLEAELGGAPLARRVRDLSDEVGMPTSLRKVGIGADDLPQMVDEVMTMYPRPNNPMPFERERLLELYRHFLDGDLEAALAA